MERVIARYGTSTAPLSLAGQYRFATDANGRSELGRPPRETRGRTRAHGTRRPRTQHVRPPERRRPPNLRRSGNPERPLANHVARQIDRHADAALTKKQKKSFFISAYPKKDVYLHRSRTGRCEYSTQAELAQLVEQFIRNE